jgi:acetylornithine/succinyldiaminopimelate/putrescine aminotransferase/predicted amino acid dehydrogenase
MHTSLLNKTRQELLDFVGLNEAIEHAQGTQLTTASGETLTDFVGQFGAVPFGYNPAPILEAAKAFLDAGQPSFVQPLLNPQTERLAQRLVELAPGTLARVALTTSGAETVEAAIKLARAVTGRELVLGTHTGFHGKTQGAVGVTGKPVYREPFQVKTSGFLHVPYGDLPALQAALHERRVAAFFVEPVQGEAGMITAPAGYLRKAQELCRLYGTLFVVDEIQTGLGRTGNLFASEAEGLEPDILLLAKALGGGLVPIGACLYGEHCWNRDFDRFHSSTFGINGFTAAVALAALEQLTADNRRLVREVAEKGAYLRDALDTLVGKYPDVFEGVDGRGLMHGLKFRAWPGERLYTLALASSVGALVPIVCGYLKKRHGVYCLPTLSESNVLRIQPPLIISRAEIDRLIHGLTAAAELISGDQQHRLVVEAHGFPPQPAAPRKVVTGPAANKGGRCLGRFAFLLHPTTDESVNGDGVVESLDLAADERRFMQDWLAEFSEWAKPDLDTGITYHARRIHNAAGDYVEGWLVGSLLQPKDLMRLSLARRKKLLGNYLDTVDDLDVDFVGLGAYTSVISSAGMDVINERFHTTTGNSLTAMVGIEGLASTCLSRGKPLAKRLTGVIGAYGSVGRLASLKLARICERLVLLGNAANKAAMHELSLVAGEIYRDALQAVLTGEPAGVGKTLARLLPERSEVQRLLELGEQNDGLLELFQTIEARAAKAGCPAPLTIASDLARWLPELEAILSATSNGSAFIDPAALRANAVICDCAQPPDIRHHTLQERPDVSVVEGGLIYMPERGYRFGSQNLTNLPTGVAFSCLAETIVLTMAGKDRDYSIGKRPSLADAEEILRLALEFGFAPAVDQLVEKAG